MNIVCVICSELLTPSKDVFHTPCGHIFHHVCLLQWLERAHTCPQCRVTTTIRTIHRLYFNFSNNDSIVEDATSLQNKIDNLNFKLNLKNKSINNLTEDNDELKKQAAGLRQKIYETESEISSKNSAIHALKEQIKFYKQRSSNAENDRKENEELKEKIEHLKNVQNLIDSSKSKLDNIITTTNDNSKLMTYIGVLKGELDNMREKNKELREKLRNMQQKFMHSSKENKYLAQGCAKQKELEKQLMRCESEKILLQNQLYNMQTDAQKCVCNKIFAEQESYKQENLTMHKEPCTNIEQCTMNESIAKMMECTPKLKKSNSCIIDPDSTKNISQNKSQNFFSIRDHGIKRQQSNNNLKVPSILVKKSRINPLSQKTASGSGMSFDGFGGHAKYDKFPNPISSLHIKKTREDSKTNKSKLNTDNNKKISDLLMLYNDIII